MITATGSILIIRQILILTISSAATPNLEARFGHLLRIEQGVKFRFAEGSVASGDLPNRVPPVSAAFLAMPAAAS